MLSPGRGARAHEVDEHLAVKLPRAGSACTIEENEERLVSAAMQRSPAYRLFTQWSTRIAYLRGVAAALDHMHSHSRVHRDLTSTNLLVTEDWQAKVTSPLPPPPLISMTSDALSFLCI